MRDKKASSPWLTENFCHLRSVNLFEGRLWLQKRLCGGKLGDSTPSAMPAGSPRGRMGLIASPPRLLKQPQGTNKWSQACKGARTQRSVQTNATLCSLLSKAQCHRQETYLPGTVAACNQHFWLLHYGEMGGKRAPPNQLTLIANHIDRGDQSFGIASERAEFTDTCRLCTCQAPSCKTSAR